MIHGRRMFLKGSGGIALAIPTLTSLWSRQARAAYVAPKRFVAISADHGVVENLWYPSGYKQRTLPAGQTYTERDLTQLPGSVSSIIGAPFDSLRPKLMLFRGLDSAIFGPQAGHMRSNSLCGTYLNEKQPGSSIDVVLSRSSKVKLPGTSIAHVNCGLIGENHSFSLTNGAMKSTFMYNDAKQLFDFLFSGFSAPNPADNAGIIRRKTLLINSVSAHYRAVAGSPKLGTDDKRVLEGFMTGLSSVEQRIKDFKLSPSCQVKAPMTGFAKDDVFQYERRLNEIMDTVALALKCGIVQVAHIGLPTPEDSRPPPASGYAVFKNLDTDTSKFTLPIHDYSHGAGNAKDVNPIFQRWLASFVARFMSALDVQESAESPSTFLDNSLVMFNNNLSNGNIHLRYDLPVLLGGSLGGRFRTGKFLDYAQNMTHTIENSVGKPVGADYNRFLVALLQGFGLSEADYQQPGQPPGFGSDSRHRNLHTLLDTSKRREPLPGILAG